MKCSIFVILPTTKVEFEVRKGPFIIYRRGGGGGVGE